MRTLPTTASESATTESTHGHPRHSVPQATTALESVHYSKLLATTNPAAKSLCRSVNPHHPQIQLGEALRRQRMYHMK